MQLIADRVVVIGRGRLIAEAGIDELLRGRGGPPGGPLAGQPGGPRVRVRTPQADVLRRALDDRAGVNQVASDELEVSGLAAADVGQLAHAAGVPLHHLAEVEQSLEAAYLALTEASVDYRGGSKEPATQGADR